MYPSRYGLPYRYGASNFFTRAPRLGKKLIGLTFRIYDANGQSTALSFEYLL